MFHLFSVCVTALKTTVPISLGSCCYGEGIKSDYNIQIKLIQNQNINFSNEFHKTHPLTSQLQNLNLTAMPSGTCSCFPLKGVLNELQPLCFPDKVLLYSFCQNHFWSTEWTDGELSLNLVHLFQLCHSASPNWMTPSDYRQRNWMLGELQHVRGQKLWLESTNSTLCLTAWGIICSVMKGHPSVWQMVTKPGETPHCRDN